MKVSQTISPHVLLLLTLDHVVTVVVAAVVISAVAPKPIGSDELGNSAAVVVKSELLPKILSFKFQQMMEINMKTKTMLRKRKEPHWFCVADAVTAPTLIFTKQM
jgi:hypothetical protein